MLENQKPAVKHITIRKNGTRRITLDCSAKTSGGGADQSQKNASDVNTIMEQYVRTGHLPSQIQSEPRFIDNTLIPDLETAFEITQNAYNQFKTLPPEVRKAMGNDPANLESYIQDPQNQEFLIKHNVIQLKEKETTLKDLNKSLKDLKESKKPTE